jgi:hypothetical protein
LVAASREPLFNPLVAAMLSARRSATRRNDYFISAGHALTQNEVVVDGAAIAVSQK